MTEAELKGIAAQALNMAKRDMEKGDFNFLFAGYFEGEGMHRMSEAEKLVIKSVGDDWLNHGRTKDIAFSLFRHAVDLMPPDAVVFVTVVNGFSVTPKFRELSPAKQEELLQAGHDRHHEAVKEGLLTMEDRLNAVVQTPELVCVYSQAIDRHRQFSGKTEVHFHPQDGFGGRMKMYGVEDEKQKEIAGRIELPKPQEQSAV